MPQPAGPGSSMPNPTAIEGTMDRQTKRSSTAPKLVLEPVRGNSRLDSYPLATGRYLIGSAHECDIVIALGGVAPQHCLMIVGTNKTVVKAISPLTWINDGPLTEAVLKHGERLILGPVELRTRLPEVSEWIELHEGKSAPPAVPASYEPPQIEELLDHARQQLQTAIDDHAAPPTDSWSEDLPLSEAVQMHAAVGVTPPSDAAKSAELAAWHDVQQANRLELERREVELAQRLRALDDLGAELAVREGQLFSRERDLISHEARLQSGIQEVDQREQALVAEERAFQVRKQAETTASQELAEKYQTLDEEQVRVQQLMAMIAQKVPELQLQTTALNQRAEALHSCEAELTAREEELHQQSQQIQSLAAVSPVDTSAVELRETTVARREAVLGSSIAALQTSRDQIAQEAAQLEQRFAELIEREQAVQQQMVSLADQTKRAQTDILTATTQLAALGPREQSVAASAADLTEREETLLKTKSQVETRDRELNALRTELDIREESLNQQFSQLQLDRSGFRASQSKWQLTEQATNQRLAEIEAANQQRVSEFEVEVVRRRQELDSLAMDWEQKSTLVQNQLLQHESSQREVQTLQRRVTEQELARQDAAARLANVEQKFAGELARFEQERATHTAARSETETLLAADQEQQWANLAQEQAEFALDQRDLQELRAELESQQAQLQADRESVEALRQASNASVDEAHSVGGHLQALLNERQAVAQLQVEVEREHHALRVERDEAQRIRTKYDQEQEKLQTIQSESASERDIYLLERQTLIADRHALQDRERLIQQTEAEIEQLRTEAAQASAELDFQRKQMETQRVHLDEEWSSLREERTQLKQAESELDVQREDLTLLAQQLSDLQPAGSEIAHSGVAEVASVSRTEEVAREAVPERSVKQSQPPALSTNSVNLNIPWNTVPEDQADLTEEEAAKEDSLAGFASFSSIGSTTDDLLPPEIAAIIQKVGGPSIPQVSVPPVICRPDLDQGRFTSPSFNGSKGSQDSPLDPKEEQRLRDLLGRSSESFVDAASAPIGEDYDSFKIVSDQPVEHFATSWAGDGTADAVVESPVNVGATKEEPLAEEPPKPAAPKADSKSTELRSRLSEMFGINLGGMGQTRPAALPEVESTSVEEEPEQWQSVDQDAAEETLPQEVEGISQVEESAENAGEEPPPSDSLSNIDEAADPVAAYMEQLLARTRKSKDGSSAKAATAAPKLAPPPIAVAPVVQRVEPQSKLRFEPAPPPPPPPPRPTRKHEPVDKEAMRANLDSFRSIANSQARSDVARSEYKRLVITTKLKKIFLGISGGIALVLLSTELWTTHRYRLEILAAVIATVFLGWDQYRNQRRLRELGMIVPNEVDAGDDAEEEAESAD